MLHDLDWVVTFDDGDDELHHITLPDDQAQRLEDDGTLGVEDGSVGPFRLDCGREVRGVSIPGIFSRMSLPRCVRCCAATGLPQGIGSPKNDHACRVILGLDKEPAVSDSPAATPHTMVSAICDLIDTDEMPEALNDLLAEALTRRAVRRLAEEKTVD